MARLRVEENLPVRQTGRTAGLDGAPRRPKGGDQGWSEPILADSRPRQHSRRGARRRAKRCFANACLTRGWGYCGNAFGGVATRPSAPACRRPLARLPW